MQPYEIGIIVLACAFVLGVCVWRIVRHAKGKGGCDCGECGECGGNCPACRQKKQKDQ